MIVVLANLVATGPIEAQASPQVTTISAATIRALPEWKIGEPVLRIGENPGDESTLLNRAGMPIRLSDGRIAIAIEQKEIRYFDAKGKFLSIAGQRGQGPGDFRQLMSIFPLSGDSILAYDSYGPPNRLDVFSPAGRFVRMYEEQVMSTALQVLADRSLVFLARGETALRAALNAGTLGVLPDTSVVVLKRPGGNPDSLMRIPLTSTLLLGGQRWTGVLLSPSLLLTAGPAGIVAGSGAAFELHWFSATGKPVRLVRVDQSRVRVTGAIKARYLASQPQPTRRLAVEEGPRPDPVYAEYLPIVERIRMDRAGRVWVRRWTFQNEPTAEWIVFSAAGRPVARVNFPGTF